MRGHAARGLCAFVALACGTAVLLAVWAARHMPQPRHEDAVPVVRVEDRDADAARETPTSPEGHLPPAGEVVTRRDSARDVPAEATDVLGAYASQGRCVLVRAGYLDLSGKVWGCVVQGDGWSEVTVVSAAGDGGGSEVSTVRMDATAFEEVVMEEVGGVGGGREVGVSR